MSHQSNQIWAGLSEQLQSQIKEELITITQEVLNDYIRTHHNASFDAQSHDLYPSIHLASGVVASGEFASTVRAQTASHQPGVERDGHRNDWCRLGGVGDIGRLSSMVASGTPKIEVAKHLGMSRPLRSGLNKVTH